jgi:hypothetical protein
MTFSFTFTGRDIFGSLKVVYGTYVSSGGDTGGDISLTREFHKIEILQLQPFGGSALSASVNESLPLATTEPTIITSANQAGTFLALGR